VYACGHLLCGDCGADSKCRRDGSYTVIQEEEVIQSIQTIQETYGKLQTEGGTGNWSTYYETLDSFKRLMAGKFSQKCAQGHNYCGEGCRTCWEAAEHTQVPALQWTHCPTCNSPMTDLCYNCDQGAVQTGQEQQEKRHCGQCGRESETEVCGECQQAGSSVQRDFSAAQSEFQAPEIPLPVTRSKLWACGKCPYKFCAQKLTFCPNCHTPRP